MSADVVSYSAAISTFEMLGYEDLMDVFKGGTMKYKSSPFAINDMHRLLEGKRGFFFYHMYIFILVNI